MDGADVVRFAKIISDYDLKEILARLKERQGKEIPRQGQVVERQFAASVNTKSHHHARASFSPIGEDCIEPRRDAHHVRFATKHINPHLVRGDILV